MNGLTQNEIENIKKQTDKLSNKEILNFNWSENPSKQSLAAAVLYELGIPLNEIYFSKGGTVTKEALQIIVSSLDQESNMQPKHDLAGRLGLMLGIESIHKNLSNGSTITRDFWNEVLVRVINIKSKGNLTTFSSHQSSPIALPDKELGAEGEKFVFEFEKRRLTNLGFVNLANKVLDVSQKNCGYDILSFDNNRDKRLIEVKTTKHDQNFPFYLTRNEVNVSKINSMDYWLYRVYNFSNGYGEILCLKGDMELVTTLTPRSFSAIKDPHHPWLNP